MLDDAIYEMYYTWKCPDRLTQGNEHKTIMARITSRITPDKNANPGPIQPIPLLSVNRYSQYLITVVFAGALLLSTMTNPEKDHTQH